MIRRLIALIVVLTACSGGGGEGPGSSTSVPGGTTDTTATSGDTEAFVVPSVTVPGGSTGVPGLYLPPEVVVASTRESGFDLVASRPCDEVFEILDSGEWETVARVSPDPDVAFALSFGYGFSRAATLQWGDDRLFVRGTATDLIVDDPTGEVPASDFCMLRVDRLFDQPITISGPVEFSGEATVYPLRCIEAEGVEVVTMGYQLPDWFVQLTFEAQGPTGTADVPGESLELTGLPVDRPIWELVTSLSEEIAADGEGFEAWATGPVAGTASFDGPRSGSVTLDRITTDSGTAMMLDAPWSCAGS